MYLKSIEIQGFKSFANKITFDFHNGITAIVGPNGSGKSNVADAVRWVLGEQRIKQLRGASMQDVIFSGTEQRRPQGFAYVAITLNNEDHQLAISYDEVTVSRRLYRSGESEYMINGSACRLKDINELFYDTGIGKEGYSIIGQGQIDKILSGKPEERRELFDEAAGIVKFKRRKALAQKKLDDEQQNLLRVKDILSELEKQAGPLAAQSETAKKYLAFREELKSWEVGLFLMETGEIRRQSAKIDENSQVVSGDMAQAKEEAAILKEEQDRIEQAIRGLDGQIEETRSLLNQSDMHKNSLQGQINVLNEQINTEHLRAAHIRERSESINKEIEEKDAQIASYEEECQKQSLSAEESRRKKAAAQKALSLREGEISRLETDLEDTKAGLIRNLNEKAGLSAKQQRYSTLLEQVQVRKAEVSQRLLRFKSDESVHEEEQKVQQGKLKTAQEAYSALRASQESCRAEAESYERETRELSDRLSKARQQQHTAAIRLESLSNLAERYEGYGSSTRRVMERKGEMPGIKGVVAEIISTEQRYETAIETALGSQLQNVVTDNEQTAKKLIEYLKRNRYGRQTFLPLASIRHAGGFARPEALKEPGVLGLGSDLVKAEPEYGELVRYLLGRVVVADTVDHAIALAKKYKYTLRIVTLEGELLSAGGSIAGGAYRNSSNLLGRRRELEELEQLCQKTRKEAGELEKELSGRESYAAAKKEELERMGQELQEASILLNTLQLRLRQIEEKKREIRESSGDLQLERSQLDAQREEVEKNQEALRAEVLALEQASGHANEETLRLSAELEAARAAREQSAKELESMNLEVSNAKQKLDFIKENIRRVREEEEHLREEQERLLADGVDPEALIKEKETQIALLREQIAQTDEKKQEWEVRAEELLAKKGETMESQRASFARREELSGRISHLDRDLFRLQGQKEKLDEKLEAQVNYMWEEYELTLAGAQALRGREPESLGTAKKKIEDLKGSIRSLGHVNVNAIEDYKEISERLDFMKAQHDDLEEAKAELLKIIDELDSGMRRQFGEKFKEIQDEFDRVFKELFGGGHGRLELMEDEDILEAGIQIIAQPPGKKLQNMMQLSGGEKALTAIALLFAIQNLKPSPFCLLDEIEAALDDSNVDRFAGYLHKLTKNTQFIVITHRRGTMVSADRLYGITMQEKGISTLVSVNLIEEQLDG